MWRVLSAGASQQIAGLIALASLTVTLSGESRQSRMTAENIDIPKNAAALEGLPSVRIDTTRDATTRRQLDSAEAAKNELKIAIVDGKYYWANRGNRPLTLSSSAEFTYLSSTEPGKYVRLRRLNDTISYVEHVDMPLGSVTYWGEVRIILRK
jgi:hypothetical protein